MFNRHQQSCSSHLRVTAVLFLACAIGIAGIGQTSKPEELVQARLVIASYPGDRNESAGTTFDVSLDAQGTVEAIQYIVASHLVVKHHVGTIDVEATKRILNHLQDDSFLALLQQGTFAGSGAEEGEPFWLQVIQGPKHFAGGGLTSKLPDQVRDQLTVMRRLVREAEGRPVATAYIRFTPIDQRRLNSLQRAGKLRFYETHELPESFREKITSAIEHNRSFVTSTQKDIETLLPLCSHGRDLYVIRGPRGFEVTLLEARQQEQGAKPQEERK